MSNHGFLAYQIAAVVSVTNLSILQIVSWNDTYKIILFIATKNNHPEIIAILMTFLPFTIGNDGDDER